MKKKKLRRGLSLLLAVLIAGVCLLSGCGAQKNEAQENAETIQVYLWNTTLYENYAPYIQSQLPDVNIEFIVGNNDLDFYKFLNENGGLPDIITSCRFSLHDAAPLKDSLMNLALTNEAGAVYNTYLDSFKNEDGSVNWLPVCADAHGFVVNRGLFEEYGIPLPTDYASFVSACKAFEKHGIRGFDADYFYDYTCMETLQGLSVSELSSAEGRRWRTAYSDPASTEKVGLDDAVWPAAFENLENFIRDTGLNAADLTLTYDDIMDIMHEEASADMLGMVGADPEESVDTPWKESVRKRLPWLVVNMVNSALSASVVYMFEGSIAQMAALAVLMPMVANQAGNTGQQALAVMIRQLATDRFETKKAWMAVLREAKIGLVTGLFMAMLALCGAWGFTGNPLVGMVMAGALLCDMMLGAVAGGSIPLIFRALGRDPAQASSIFLTTITDGAGFFIFLGLATMFLF